MPSPRIRWAHSTTTASGLIKTSRQRTSGYKLAAEQGEVRAQACLAGMYEAGIGVLQNLAEALKWYQSASEGGDAEAQANLGAIYANGSGVAKDYSSRSNAVVEKRSGAAAGESRKSPKG